MGATDKMKDKAQVARGNAKTKVGRATDDPGMEADRKADRVRGQPETGRRKVKDALKPDRQVTTAGGAPPAAQPSSRRRRGPGGI